MVEKTDRTPEDGSRSTDGRRFEIFVREEEADPLRHVGSVAASTPDAAHEEASALFAWFARDVWVCPAEETHRYSAESLADERGRDGDSTGDESGDGDADAASDGEPRVYEETEGTPAVGDGPRASDAEGSR
ncbi:Htur_1727 family rSAM-partnered candidate RiPP [Halorubrum laminariae]|uniref:Htur_1727 family rSAM-partnered candidate RiPP n=1 Tax=Halorubrum laminariae TaxID=1433523 RepID=A0ABD6BWR7_9EURY|nr:Htur_1727 family rSAM-partnered candidate RiPP [Halorubrum laminariae]